MCHIKNLQVIQQAEGTEPSFQDGMHWFRAPMNEALAQEYRSNSSWDSVLNYPKQSFDTGIPIGDNVTSIWAAGFQPSSWESQSSPKTEIDAKRQKVSEN